jgi:hypothetical protein
VTAPTHRVEFVRIGRNHNVPPIEVSAANADEIAEVVWRVARRHLISRDFDVTVDLDAGKGYIEGGRFGQFSVVDLTTEGGAPCS